MDSGQVFGFRRLGRGRYEGSIDGRPVHLEHVRGSLTAAANGAAPSARRLREYFDLDRDLGPLYEFLGSDGRTRPALRAYRGLRLIRQDAWESVAGFILSANNNIKRIRSIWAGLSRYLGGDGLEFPSPARIAAAHERALRQLGLGYRAPYLQRTACFLSRNDAYLSEIRKAPLEEARTRVMALPGIGPKVADCVLLYGFQRYEAFPVDVWILRVMRSLFFKGRRATPEKVRELAARKWGRWAGYVQQYLFHASRTGVI